MFPLVFIAAFANSIKGPVTTYYRVLFLIMDFGPARAGFLEPGRLTLGALFGVVVGDPQLARGPLLKNHLESRLTRSKKQEYVRARRQCLVE